MNEETKPRTRMRRTPLSATESNDRSLIVVEENPSMASEQCNDSNASIGKCSFRPGKWRRSKSFWRHSVSRREGSSRSIGGERRITRVLTDCEPSKEAANQTLRDESFTTPLLTWKTVADHCYLAPENAKKEILQRCGQEEAITFERMLENLQVAIERKIGEGVYGEVFLCRRANGEQSVLKLVPIDGSLRINGEKQKSFDEILSEIIISSELSSLRQENVQFCTDAFVELRSVSCIRGCYPKELVDLWAEYNDKHGSENDSPEEFPNDQHYIAFETAFGGSDLDGYRFSNALQIFSVFAQIVLALAVAEKRFDFEHRDLHTGNVLITTTKESEQTYHLLGQEIVIKTHGIKATIIDYTLSRIIYNGLCLFNDLSAEEELFTAEGDYQFEIYRKMKSVLRNQWNLHTPKTNVYWLHYLLDKLNSTNKFKARVLTVHRTTMKSMKEVYEQLLQFNSVYEIAQHYFTAPSVEADKEN